MANDLHTELTHFKEKGFLPAVKALADALQLDLHAALGPEAPQQDIGGNNTHGRSY
jgi:hypothetical protein